MARKRNKGAASGTGRGGGGDTSSSLPDPPSSSSAPAGSTSAAPIPCPPGYLWDGKRFYKMPPNLSRVQVSEGSSGSEGEKPGSSKKKAKSSGDTKIKRSSSHHSRISQLQDITDVALEGEDYDGDQATPRSVFAFTPASPPAGHIKWSSSSGLPAPMPPRSSAPSSASAHRWKMSTLQRQIDSYKFFSRDVLDGNDLPMGLHSSIESEVSHSARIDTFDATGSLVWLQAQCVERRHYDGITTGSLYFDSAGRTMGGQRFTSSWQKQLRESSSATTSEIEEYGEDATLDCYWDASFLRDSHIGFSPVPHPGLPSDSQHDIRLFDFDEESPRSRGLVATNHEMITGEEVWSSFDMPTCQKVLTATVSPSLLADKPCREIMKATTKQKNNKRWKSLYVAIVFDIHQNKAPKLSEIHWAPSGVAIVNIPRTTKKEHSAVALSEGTGLCWLGYSDGHIDLFDPSEYTTGVIDECEPYREGAYSAGVYRVIPDIWEALPKSTERGAVTNLITVGTSEVVAAFSTGAVLLLKITDNEAVIVRQYVGHVNTGTRCVKMSVHQDSRMMAILGTDRKLRIWHLDNEYPFNTSWHRQRPGYMPPLDLLPLSDSQQERLLKRTKDQHGEAATQSAGKPALVVLDRMGIRPLHDSKAQAAMQVRVEDMVWRQSCGMAFTPTAWAADRDQQWEMTRNFDRRGKPQVITPGLLPGIACCIPSGYGISVVYLEPERREGVRIEVEESEGQGKKEAKEGEEGEEEKSGSSSAQS